MIFWTVWFAHPYTVCTVVFQCLEKFILIASNMANHNEACDFGPIFQ